MTDYEAIAKQARICANRKYCDIGGNCEYYDLDVCCQGGEKDILKDAADAIEELQNLIAEVGKMVDELITYAQKNADESREAEQRHYGSDSTVNVYTWMHNVKCVHERYVAMLDDITAKLPEPPKGVE